MIIIMIIIIIIIDSIPKTKLNWNAWARGETGSLVNSG